MLKIREFSVKNFRTIDELQLTNLDSFNILVGENNTGKSSILDAIHIFISNLTPLRVGRGGSEYPDELWPGATRDNDIHWEAEIHYTRDEFSAVLQDAGLSETTVIELLGPDKFSQEESGIEVSGAPCVKLARTLSAEDKRWHTESVQINQLEYYRSRHWTTDNNRSELDKLDTAFMHNLSAALKYVRTVRGSVTGTLKKSWPRYSGNRNTLVPSETIAGIIELFSNWNDANQKRIAIINDLFGALTTGCEVKARGETLFVDDGQSKSPIQSVGGGTQEMLQLAYDISEESDLLLLEEPELHLHPRLTQNLFHRLNDLSNERQLFIATHSTTFIDQANLSNILLVTRGKKGTQCNRLQVDDALPRIADELGLLPSHACQSNCILFVEGPSDRIVLSKWCEVAGLRLRRPMVHVEEMDGKEGGKHKANWWGRVAEALPRMGLGLIFDGDLKNRPLREIKRAIGSENRVWRLDEGTIEDYYPLDKLKEAILSNVELSENQESDIRNLQQGRVAQKIDDILEKGENWKVKAAETIASACTSADDIPSDIHDIVLELIDFINSKSKA